MALPDTHRWVYGGIAALTVGRNLLGAGDTAMWCFDEATGARVFDLYDGDEQPVSEVPVVNSAWVKAGVPKTVTLPLFSVRDGALRVPGNDAETAMQALASYEAALASAADAATSAQSAIDAANLVGAPADTAVNTLITPGSGSTSLATLNSTIAAAVAPVQAEADANDASLSAVDSTQRLLAVLANESRDAAVLVVGDSTGNEAGEWVDLLTRALAVDWPAWIVKYQLWNDGTGAYDAATTIQTGTGSRTLTVSNASVSGFSTTSWLGSRAAAAIYALTPDLVMVSIGHNEQNIATDLWHSRYLSLTESLTERLSADLIVVAQNPETANTLQQARCEVYREVAARRGYGFIDVQQAFLDTGAVATYTAADGIHPNPAGSQLWAATVKAAFVRAKRPPRTQTPSTLLQRGANLLANGDFAAFGGAVPDSWSATNVTAAVDATNFESATINRATGGVTAAKAVKFTATGAGQATIAQYVPISLVKGRWVTLAARLYVPAGQASTVARFSISDSTGSTLHPAETSAQGSFRWVVVTRFIPASATNCRVLIYVDSAVAGTGNCTIDRVVMVTGKYPQGA